MCGLVHMRRRSGLIPLLVLAWLALGVPASAQYDTVHVAFNQITIQDGLSEGMINGILQDRAGYMWFATKDGLNRYDGYDFKVFRHDHEDSTSLGSSHVLGPLAARDGLLWVGTSSGLDVFDPATERFHHVVLPNNGTAVRPGSQALNRLAQDARGRIWALGYRGMFRVSTPLPPLGTAPIVATPMTGPIDLRMLTMDSHGILRAWHNGSLVTVQLDTRKDDPRWDTVRYAPAHNGSQAGSHRVAALGLLTVPDTVLGKNHGVHTTGVVQFDEA